MSDILADRLQIWGFEDEFTIFVDGSIGFGLDVVPLDVSCAREEQINSLADRTAQFLNGLPSGIDIQFIQEIGRGNSATIQTHKAMTTPEASETAKTLCVNRVERLAGLDAEGLLPAHRLKLFVRRPLTKPLIERKTLFSKEQLFPSIAGEHLARELQAARLLRDDIIASLAGLELSSRMISTDALSELIYWQWNPCRRIGLNGYDPDDVRSSLIFTDASINEHGFSLAEMHHRVISLKMLPDQTFASMAATLRELSFDSRLFLTCHVPDQQKELAALQTQRRLAYSMAHGKRTGVADLESEAKFQDLETLLAELIAQGEKVFQVSMSIVLRSRNRDELDAQVSLTLSKLRELAGAEGMEESLAAFDIFSEIAIPNARAKERMKRMKTSTLADLLPIFGPWRGHERASILLRSRAGSLVTFDPFATELTNYNHVVSGGSGSGKSFMTNILLLQMLKEAPRIFIVDIGGSYKRLSENLSGQYIALGVGGGVAVNPFDLLPGEAVPSAHKIKFLTGLIELMTKEEEETRLPRLERAEIEEAIAKVYESGGTPTMSRLRELLLAHEDVTIRRYGRILSSWCGNTAYGQFVDRPTTIAFERPIVAFDLKGMETYPDLQAVCLYIITDFIWREIQRDRTSKKFLIFDECWKLLENEAGSGFIAEVFRTFRKYYAAAIAISQNMDDFAKSKVAGAILSNSSIKWCLTQRGADQSRLKEVLQLNDQEVALIASLHQERGVYSEAFLMAQDRRAVVAIESTPLEYWLATTDPRDLGAIEQETRAHAGTQTIDILRTLSERYPRGVAATQGGAA